MALAGIWEWRPDGGPDGRPLWSASMLTINADGHGLMHRFHKPEDEKRMVVVLELDQIDAWLHATPAEAPNFLTRFPAEAMVAEPAPRPAAKRPPVPKAVPKKTSP